MESADSLERAAREEFGEGEQTEQEVRELQQWLADTPHLAAARRDTGNSPHTLNYELH